MTKLVIEDVDEGLMSDLVTLASRNHLSPEAQAKLLLREYVPAFDRSGLIAIADAIAALTPKDRPAADSVDLLRQDRSR